MIEWPPFDRRGFFRMILAKDAQTHRAPTCRRDPLKYSRRIVNVFGRWGWAAAAFQQRFEDINGNPSEAGVDVALRPHRFIIAFRDLIRVARCAFEKA